MDSGLFVSGTWIPDFRQLHSGSHTKNLPHSAFHKKEFPGFRDPDSLTWGDLQLFLSASDTASFLLLLTGYSRRSHPVPQNLKCTETEAEEGVTLKGGLKAGNFTDVGTVESIDSCTRLCCVSERCNLAMLINGHCFLVNCFSKELCKTVKTETKNYRPTVAFVRRWVTNVTEDTGMCGSALKVNATTSWQIRGGGGGGWSPKDFFRSLGPHHWPLPLGPPLSCRNV